MLKNVSPYSIAVQTKNGCVTVKPNETISAKEVIDEKGLLAYGTMAKVKVEEPKKQEPAEPTEPKVEETKKPKAKAPKCAKKVNQPEIE